MEPPEPLTAHAKAAAFLYSAIKKAAIVAIEVLKREGGFNARIEKDQLPLSPTGQCLE
jgi:hypothetical protein